MRRAEGFGRTTSESLRARILCVLSSGSVTAALVAGGGCSGTVERGGPDDTGTGGSAGGTVGTSGTSGRGGTGPGVGGAGGVGAGGGIGGAGGAGAVGGIGGFGGAGAVGGTAGSYPYGGSTAVGGSAGAPVCSTPNMCLTCSQIVQQFGWFLDQLSCSGAGDAGDIRDGAFLEQSDDATFPPDSQAPDPAFACPELRPASGFGCQVVCTPPVQRGALCCYGLTAALPACGRPFSVGEELRAAPIVGRNDWNAFGPAAGVDLDDELSLALAGEWQSDAVLEHASIASFARLTLELLALGAPPGLVRASQDASLDEIEHARLCFALAGRYSRNSVGPGPLAIDGVLAERPDLETLAAETVREGCVGETLAALLAREQLDVASDPAVRAALERIATDEARHAELSWALVRWAISAGGECVLRRAAIAFETAMAGIIAAEPPCLEGEVDASDRAEWHAHGRLLPSERSAIVRAALRDVIRPCAQALLA